jgi:lysophospholipase L1-like esterase
MLLVSLALLVTAAPVVVVPGVDPEVRVIGAAELDGGQGALLRFSSSGVRLRARGIVRFIWQGGDKGAEEGGGNRFDVVVDDGAFRRVIDADAGSLDVPVLSTLTLVKRTEALFGARRLLGVVVDGEVSAVPSRPTLVVLGDSWATGFGVRGDIVDHETGKAPGPHCPFSPDTEDVRQAWPALVADGLGVDVAVVAWSGRGLLRDWQGDERPAAVPRLLDDSAVHPENVVGVVVALGHNDANEGLPDPARFAAAWQQTLALLRARFGAVTVVVVAPAFDDAPPAVDRAGVLRPAFVGDGVVVVDEPPMDTSLGLGCVWHPGTAAQSAFARQLLPPIARALGR